MWLQSLIVGQRAMKIYGTGDRITGTMQTNSKEGNLI